jgi:hypothetical protein
VVLAILCCGVVSVSEAIQVPQSDIPGNRSFAVIRKNANLVYAVEADDIEGIFAATDPENGLIVRLLFCDSVSFEDFDGGLGSHQFLLIDAAILTYNPIIRPCITDASSFSTIFRPLYNSAVLHSYLAWSTIPDMALRDYEPQDAILAVRMRRTELEIIKKAAKNKGLEVSDAVRKTMLTWAKRNGK